MLKNRKIGNRNGQQNLKTEVFQYKNRKTELKNLKSQRRHPRKGWKGSFLITDNSSFEKDREKAKADALAYRVKVAAKKGNATGHG